MVEEYLERKLAASNISGFSMPTFLGLLSKRKREVSGDILEILGSDFQEFKETILSYKAPTELDLAPSLTVHAVRR